MRDFTNHIWPGPHQTGQEEIDNLLTALSSPDWSHTDLCSKFERNFASFIGTEFALLVPSGTAAIYLALIAAGIQEGQEVIIPGLTWPSVVYAIVKAGGVPRTVDISADTLCIDKYTLEGSHTDRTFAVLATHLFGSQCDMHQIHQYARQTGIVVIEDSAQSIGSIQSGKSCGTWGSVGIYSFNDRKVLACGEGGCIVTNSQDTYQQLKYLQLIQPNRATAPLSLPGTYKISEFQAAVALGQLSKLKDRLHLMSERASVLANCISEFTGGVAIPQTQPSCVDVQSYYNFAFLVKGHPEIQEFRLKLSKNLNFKAAAPYNPLSDVADFQPLQKHHRSTVYQNLQIEHPNCQNAFENECVRFAHNILLSDEGTIRDVAETIAITLTETMR
ncbi:DegT/DnrJ/EryC1/StrS family aminotransferase [Minwuia sp.]|uniref:DegT/DnrJ/EryC1/StrS family aminotransferase n=1 Tax=Minwuia sp. TaxID=2493630 RepID=UPI003A906720